MSLISSVPMSIGQVLDTGFKLYRQAFSRLVPFMLISGLLGMLPGVLSVMQGGSVGTQSPAAHLMSFCAAVIGVVIAGSYFVVIDDVARGGTEVGFSQAINAALRCGPRLIGATIVFALVFMIGLLLLVIPGLILLISMIFTTIFVVLENTGPTDSIHRSRALVKGHWWRVATVVTVAGLIFAGLFVGIGTLIALIVPFTDAASRAADDESTVVAGLLIFFVLNGVLGALLTPYFYATYYTTYRDLQLRKSGADLASKIAASAA